MKDISKTLEYRGKTYKLVFNLNVMQEIQEHFGTVDKWADAMSTEGGREPLAKDIIYGFTAMLNEGIDIYNEEHDEEEKRPFFTEKQVGRIISEIGLLEAAKTHNKSVKDSTKSEEKN